MEETVEKLKLSIRKLRPAVGWREWCGLPELGIKAIKCKVDTGARTSSLHAYDLEIIKRQGLEIASFKVHPVQKSGRQVQHCEATLLEWRYVTDSGGKRTLRPVVQTWLSLGDVVKQIELTLIARDEMGFRMLLGREALRGTWVVDPARSFLASKTKKKLKKKKTRKKSV